MSTEPERGPGATFLTIAGRALAEIDEALGLPSCDDTTKPAVAGPLDLPVGRPVEDESVQACAHPNKVERHFTYGYRWHCPDCKAGGEDWWD